MRQFNASRESGATCALGCEGARLACDVGPEGACPRAEGAGCVGMLEDLRIGTELSALERCGGGGGGTELSARGRGGGGVVERGRGAGVGLRADELLLLSNVSGVLCDPADPGSLIRDVAETGLEEVRRAARGRMKNKVLAAEEAIAGGVGRVVIGSAAGADAIERARAGAGTLFEGVPA